MIAVKHSRSMLVGAALLACSSAFAANLDNAFYDASKTQIEADYKRDRAACDSFSGNTRDVCVEKAKAREKVARADLEYRNSGKASDADTLAIVKADTEYDVAKEMCDDRSGNSKDVCTAEAKAAHVRAVTDAKTSKKVADATRAAADDKREADYKVETAKCDALAGDAKAECVKSAKMRFGKS
jgi:hypothetical protein